MGFECLRRNPGVTEMIACKDGCKSEMVFKSTKPTSIGSSSKCSIEDKGRYIDQHPTRFVSRQMVDSKVTAEMKSTCEANESALVAIIDRKGTNRNPFL